MNVLSLVLQELVGMFIDDEFLAIAILIVVAAAAALAFGVGASSLLVGTVLLVGCIAVLLSSVFKTTRKKV